MFALANSLFSVHSFAESTDIKLAVPHYPQQNACWCGIATLEMVEKYYRGDSWREYAERQYNLAMPVNNGGADPGHTDQKTPTSGPCGPKGGIYNKEMSDMLNFRLTKPHNIGYKNVDYYGSFYSKFNSVINYNLHKTVLESINKKDPVIFAGQTNYRNGTTTDRASHWYVIVGVKDSDGLTHTINENDGYYIHDATVNAGLTNIKPLDKPAAFVSHFDLFNKLVPSNRKVSVMQRR